ncbi:hypothetical protein PVAND_016474 [Polypedilum vanderplanki]|uniref:Uncharacterized protein n=1 Tax=Polypedilum vanderplanki TaxID=319348 RepID=A0A9J6BFX0_POLVA|nr:hypothetical protein PVAND_016474 [Polypedilum vanderplanki]
MKFYYFVILICFISKVATKLNYRVTKIECNSSTLTVTKHKCWLRAYNRRNPVVNVEVTKARETPDLLVTYQFFYKSGPNLPYQRNFVFEDVKFCKVIKELSSNSFIAQAVEHLKTLEINYNSICNGVGDMNFFNISISTGPFHNLFPEGYHWTNYKIRDEKDEHIFSLSFYAILTK